MANLYYDNSADLALIQVKKVAIIGYGSQGHAHSLNLRDSGVSVRVGLQPGSASISKAQKEGLTVNTPAEAAAWAEVFIEGGGTPALIAIEQDASGKAKALALSYARGLGCTRARVLETTFTEETETDLFGEQAVLCSGVSELIKAGFDTLTEAGYQPEVAYFECRHELKLIVDLIYRGGLSYMRYSVSDTAEQGDYSAGPRIITKQTREEMRKILAEIRNGSFAKAWVAENEKGCPNFLATRQREQQHPVEQLGPKLRAMMPFLQPVIAPGLENKAAALKNSSRVFPLRCVVVSLVLCLPQGPPARAQSESTLAERIQKVIKRPEFAHANFGIEFYSLDTGKVVYALNADKLFVPASTTKILTEGTLLAKLGADYRFHTRVYRTGTIDKHGTLRGDLILVASGDPNLSNRIQPDGTLAFVDHDHSYNGPALPGDPLAVIQEFVSQIKSKGVRKIEGHVYVDASLMPDGDREGGTGVVMSSIIVNDNVIDLVGKPGSKLGEAVQLSVSPQNSYLRFVNNVVTGESKSKLAFSASEPVTAPDGSLTVTLTGNIPLGMEPQTAAFAVPSPTKFATAALGDLLKSAGIAVNSKAAVPIG